MNVQPIMPPANARTRGGHPATEMDEMLLVAVMDAADTQLASHAPGETVASQEALLRTLTFCYASGIYGSHDIEEALELNPQLRWLAQGYHPTAATLRAFRRHNGPLLTECLTEVLEQTAGCRPGTPCRTHPRRPGGYASRSLDRWQLAAPVAEHRAEAERRIARAVRVDSAELDI